MIFTILSVPPKSPVIVNEAGREATSQLGPYNEGSTVQISCEVSEGKFNAFISLLELLKLKKGSQQNFA